MTATTSLRTILAAGVLLSGGCATAPSGPPPYDAPDQVGSDVDPAALVGLWLTTPINPYPDQPNTLSLIEYRSDGTVTGRVEPAGNTRSDDVIGAIRYEMNGLWKLQDGSVVHHAMTLQAEPDNAFAKVLSDVINGASRELGGTADIVELAEDRIVMLGDAGIAMRYDRVEPE